MKKKTVFRKPLQILITYFTHSITFVEARENSIVLEMDSDLHTIGDTLQLKMSICSQDQEHRTLIAGRLIELNKDTHPSNRAHVILELTQFDPIAWKLILDMIELEQKHLETIMDYLKE